MGRATDRLFKAGVLAGTAGLGALASEDAEAGVITKGGRRMIEAWHGGPHKFPSERLIRRADGTEEYLVGALDILPDIPEGAELLEDFPLGRMRMDKIGTGEGAQAYGHGLYSADEKDVAKGYRDTLQSGNIDVAKFASESGIDNPSAGIRGDIVRMALSDKDPASAARNVQYKNAQARDMDVADIETLITKVRDSKGALYRTHLDVDPDTLIEWDAYLADQPKYIQNEFAKYADERGMAQETRDKFRGEHIYERLGNSIDPEKGRGMLLDRGISGIRYKDANSRNQAADIPSYKSWLGYNKGGAVDSPDMQQEYQGVLQEAKDFDNAATRNYVMFDDKNISIQERGRADPRLLAATAAGTGGILGAGMLMSPDEAMASGQDQGARMLVGALEQYGRDVGGFGAGLITGDPEARRSFEGQTIQPDAQMRRGLSTLFSPIGEGILSGFNALQDAAYGPVTGILETGALNDGTMGDNVTGAVDAIGDVWGMLSDEWQERVLSAAGLTATVALPKRAPLF